MRALLEGNGYEVHFVEGDDPIARAPGSSRRRSTRCYAQIRAIQQDARANGVHGRPRWPAIVLRTPKGWTGPKVVDGLPVEGTFRAHQVPLADVRADPEQLAMLEAWMRSYQPDELFDARRPADPRAGRARARRATAAWARTRTPTAASCCVDLDLPDFRDYALDGRATRAPSGTNPRASSARCCATSSRATATQANFRLFCPDETNSNRLGDVFEVENRCFVGTTLDIDDHVAPDGRVMEVLSEHICEGWLEGYLLTGRHGLFATYEAFAMVSASMTVQHTKWLRGGDRRCPGARRSPRSTSCSPRPAGATTTTASATRGRA